MGIIDGAKSLLKKGIDLAAPVVKKFLGGADDFVDDSARYITNSGINDIFEKEMKKNTIEMMQKYGGNLGLKEDVIKKFTYDDYSKLSKNQRAEVLQNYRNEMKKYMNAFNALDHADNYHMDNQAQLNNVWNTINEDYFDIKYFKYNIRQAGQGKGMFVDEFVKAGWDFSDSGNNLTKEQMESLKKYFDAELDQRVGTFQADFVVPEGDTSRLNYNLGMQTRYLRTPEGQKQMRLLENRKSPINRIKRKNAQYRDVYNAYKDHLTDTLVNKPDINGTWSKPQSIEEFSRKRGYGQTPLAEILEPFGETPTETVDKAAAKQIASGDPDHSGIGIWKKVAIGAGLGIAGAICISGLTEDEDDDLKG